MKNQQVIVPLVVLVLSMAVCVLVLYLAKPKFVYDKSKVKDKMYDWKTILMLSVMLSGAAAIMAFILVKSKMLSSGGRKFSSQTGVSSRTRSAPSYY